MRKGPRADSTPRWRKLLLVAAFATISSFAAVGQTPPLEELVSSVVRIKTHINPEGQTVRGLGRERDGSGIIIDNDGLVLTIGYLMVEAYAAGRLRPRVRLWPAARH
jgi:hypothetical protein